MAEGEITVLGDTAKVNGICPAKEREHVCQILEKSDGAEVRHFTAFERNHIPCLLVVSVLRLFSIFVKTERKMKRVSPLYTKVM